MDPNDQPPVVDLSSQSCFAPFHRTPSRCPLQTALIMALPYTIPLEGVADSSSNPATSTSPGNSPKTQDASTDISSPRRDSGYESPSLPSTPQHRRSRNSKTSTIPPQQSSRTPSMSPSRSSSQPTTSHRSPSSRSSLAPSTRRPSNPTSRRASFLLQPMNRASTTRPALGSRAASEGYFHLRHNPFLPPSSIFPPTPKTPRQCSFPSPINHHLRSSSLPSPTQSPQPSYSNYLPAPPIDWTLPSTRQKAYEALERDRRGLRGLWKKIIPRLCCRNQRAGFFDGEKEGKGSDASSIRRYRLDLRNDDKEEIGANGSAGGEASASRPALEGKRAMSGWGCWGIRRGGGLGDGQRQSL